MFTVQKFYISHDIVIGDGFNVDFSKADSQDQRFRYIESFVRDCKFLCTCDENTSINPKGEECLEIDYFLYSTTCEAESSKKGRLCGF